MARKRDLYIVNSITFARAPLVFLFFVLALVESYNHSKAAIFLATAFLALASVTDLLDGMLARKWKVESKFGAMADPLMDKIFYIVVFPTLVFLLGRRAFVEKDSVQLTHALVMLCFTVLYLLRDQWVTFMRSVAVGYNADVRANWMGKLRTALSFPFGCVVYVYIAHENKDWVRRLLPLWAMYAIEGFLIILNLASIVFYTRQYMPYIRRSLKPNREKPKRFWRKRFKRPAAKASGQE
jgi:CDP-diacylglycerol--glycerol-3-phosphate 3-phosphatidyltransferase